MGKHALVFTGTVYAVKLGAAVRRGNSPEVLHLLGVALSPP